MQGFNKQANRKIELAWESDKIPIWCCNVFNFVGKLHFHTFTALSIIDTWFLILGSFKPRTF